MTLVLDGAGIATLAANPEVRAEFPFLARRQPGGGCGTCPGAAPPTPPAGRVGEAVASLPPARLAVLKALTGARTVRVYLIRANRQITKDL